jgi:DnaJ-class molecular chaperone
MRLYLVEQEIGEKLEPVALLTEWLKAHEMMKDQRGIIIELEADKHYSEGVGVCQHWHYPDGDEICLECEGRGQVRIWYAMDELGPPETCPECKGTGKAGTET